MIVSRYHSHVTQKLLDGALAAAQERGVEVDVVPAPGAFELGILARGAALHRPLRGRRGARLRDPRRDVALRLRLQRGRPGGAHGRASRPACRSRSASSRCETPEQAFARAGGTAGNKGAEAVETVLDAAAELAALRTL